MSLQQNPHLSFEDWLEGERAALDERFEWRCVASSSSMTRAGICC